MVKKSGKPTKYNSDLKTLVKLSENHANRFSIIWKFKSFASLCSTYSSRSSFLQTEILKVAFSCQYHLIYVIKRCCYNHRLFLYIRTNVWQWFLLFLKKQNKTEQNKTKHETWNNLNHAVSMNQVKYFDLHYMVNTVKQSVWNKNMSYDDC